MGLPKALAPWKGQSFLAHGVRSLWNCCDVVIAVLGSNAGDVRRGAEKEFSRLVEAGALSGDLHAAKKRGARSLEIRFEANAAWRRGMLSSARVGLAAAVKLRPASVVVLPVDNPQVSGATVHELGALMAQALGSFGPAAKFPYALVPRYHGQRGHPLLLSTALARAIARDREPRDLGDAVRRHARLVGYVDVSDRGVLANVNSLHR
jgi:CTP:molybdopterin cytidylyltransferase MocA